MIQRVQSIFLFLIAVAMGTALATPLWEKSGTKSPEMAHLSALQYTQQQGVTTYADTVWYLALLIALVGVVALYAIFQYKNRLTQTALCAVNALMLTAIMGIVLYRTLYLGKLYGDPENQGDFLTGFYAIIAALVFNALANRFIRRDEKLVRGSDRLR
ncbi:MULTISPECIES: DUF4293 domain-containing protein [unclassified Spirosoma]|uniref:DUF4293 domain-containing protein n=1 Tax=unclassified Spirosoma TaxID=2621999 RepID=UPI0009600235|nr:MULTISPECIES: DUF4293 domain-containing protein [unclassified Spirosoma]MBN8826403.1 DUF4293 domain-containing protein [Spirosoma sp.]OJW75793.1 MAG: hypothetical protein BGO59_04740 [Spirosoma sp. 48-14]